MTPLIAYQASARRCPALGKSQSRSQIFIGKYEFALFQKTLFLFQETRPGGLAIFQGARLGLRFCPEISRRNLSSPHSLSKYIIKIRAEKVLNQKTLTFIKCSI